MLKLFRVRGRSMLPTLEDGDFVIGRQVDAGAVRKLDQAAIVCVEHPSLGRLIKRIRSIDRESVMLCSDGQTGSEPEAMGEVGIGYVTHRARFVIGVRSGLRRL